MLEPNGFALVNHSLRSTSNIRRNVFPPPYLSGVAGAKPAGKAAAKAAAAAVVAETKAAAARAVVQPSGPSAVKKPAVKKSRKVRGGEAASGLPVGCGQLMRGCHLQT